MTACDLLVNSTGALLSTLEVELVRKLNIPCNVLPLSRYVRSGKKNNKKCTRYRLLYGVCRYRVREFFMTVVRITCAYPDCG